MNRAQHVAHWLRMLAEKEIALEESAKKLLNEQAKAASRAYRDGGEDSLNTTLKIFVQDWYRILIVYYTKTIQDFVIYAIRQIRSSKKATFQDIAQRYIDKKALKKAKLINDTSEKKVKAALLSGQAAGLGEEDIALGISNAFDNSVSDFRAATIARTEIHEAASYAMQAGAEATNLKLIREWVAVGDDRTREAHAEADGQQRGMDEAFDVDGEEVNFPGDGSEENAINCRCTLIYNSEEIDETEAEE